MSGEPRFEPVADSGLPRDEAPWFRKPFDAVAADMDLDGDPDLLVNWHHHEPLEIFENVGGRFVQRNARGEDASGLYDNAGIPDLFTPAEEMTARIDAAGRDGLHVWHDVNRSRSWRFAWRDAARAFGAISLHIETSLPVLEVTGLEPDELERKGPRQLVVPLGRDDVRRDFGIRAARVATQLRVRIEAQGGATAPPVHAGRDGVPLRGAEFALWKPDPHGMAWVDVEGSRLPELFITRGGLGGELAPPAEPKRDRFYLPTEAGPLPYRFASPERVAPGYGRGRRVEWVDLEGDGVPELSVANRESPNRLLAYDASRRRLRDRAPELGLDRDGAAIQAWGDLDGDGRPDLFYLEGDRIDVLRQGDAGFERLDGGALGLSLPETLPAPGVVDSAALRLADFDSDGDLDLWVLSRGRDAAHRLFRRETQGFADVTEAVGLLAAPGARSVLLLDADNDGFEDALLFGVDTVLLANAGGVRFRSIGLDRPRRIKAGAACDVDGDGRTDVIALGRQRHLLRNVGGAGNTYLDVALRAGEREPIGALVRAHYSDGRIRAQRYGSAQSSAYSQSLLPLHFGIPRGATIERVGVRWPGDRHETLYAVGETGTRIVLER